jgi:Kelch motif
MKNICVVPVLLSAVALAQLPGTFATTGSMNTTRSQHTSTLLGNGKVLVTGGFSSGLPGNSLASAELYDPSTGAFTPTGAMITGCTGQHCWRMEEF